MSWATDFRKIELDYQRRYQSFDFDSGSGAPRGKFYVLEMFPYPSGSIHMGHVRNYTLGDVLARYKRAAGYNVLHPIGWDAFGLPAENAARQRGCSPMEWTENNIKHMRSQLKRLGFSYDWSRELSTCEPSYYRHEQAFFLEFFKRGIAYRDYAWVNWDPVDKTVLANEQVIEGKGWRSGAVVEKRKLNQWFLRITDFAERLLTDLERLSDWPEKVVTMQRNWIGKSEGLRLRFKLKRGSEFLNETLEVFSTRPETLFGASFCAIAMHHPLATQLGDDVVASFIVENDISPNDAYEVNTKLGCDLGVKAINPFDESVELPVYVANFVLSDYGSGAVFGCPAHDDRDREFATQYGLPIIAVIGDDGVMINSKHLDGLQPSEARVRVMEDLVNSGIAEKVINYRLRDWGISRQRYWGCPVPVIHCQNCGVVPVPLQDLPVTLPKDVDFAAQGNPLESHSNWKNVSCPKCGEPAVRDTDTLDTFFESSWYFMAFCHKDRVIDKRSCAALLPVDCYIGGVEHAILHLLYARFFTMSLADCGYIERTVSPFKRLITQGMVCHATYQNSQGEWLLPEEADLLRDRGAQVLEGPLEKMSKSKKNVVDPERILDSHGADAIRLFMISDTPPERDLDWSDCGIDAVWKFLKKIASFCQNTKLESTLEEGKKRQFYQLVCQLAKDLESVRLNCAVAKLHEITNWIYKNGLDEEVAKVFLRVMEPMVPHLAAHLWSLLGFGGDIYGYPWPDLDSQKFAEDQVVVVVQENGKLRARFSLPKGSNKQELEQLARKQAEGKLKGSKIIKVIVVPDKIVNFVTT